MAAYIESLQHLAEQFGQLQGVGRKSAMRMAFSVLDLSEEEAAIFRRGRNMGHTNVPKSATVTEYRQATGFEVLFGYLSLLGRDERIGELFSLAYAEQIQELEKGE